MFEVGFTYRADYIPSILAHRDEIDFLEIIPDEIRLGDADQKALDIRRISEHIPFTAHSIDLSIASQEDAQFHNRFDEIYRFLVDLKITHYSDHLAYTRASSHNCDAYVPPLFGADDPKIVADKVVHITEKLNKISCGFSLENVANTVFADPNNPGREGEYMSELCDVCDTNLILNIDSLLISSEALKIAPLDLLATYPVDRIDAVTIVPPDAMNIVMNEQFGVLVEQKALPLFEKALDLISPKRVVVQVRYPHNTLDTQLPYIRRLREISNNTHKKKSSPMKENVA